MTPKLSNLDIPEIKAAAAEWAKASSQIEKITLHRFKPTKIQREEGPFYAIIIWVASEIDVNIAPWMELSKRRVGMDKLYKEQVRKQYITQDGALDEEQVSKHPMYGLWNLFWKLSAKESKEREGFYCFYRDGFERSDPRFDWLVLLFNIGGEDIFEHATKDETIYDELDNTETGRAVLFSRKAVVRQEDATTTQTPMCVKSYVPEMKDNDRDIFPLKLEPLKVYAKRWVKKVRDILPDVPIERITLYHFASPYPEITHKRNPVKYCIVFNIADEILREPENADSHIDKIISGHRSIYDILECYQTIHNQDSYLFLMDAGFPSNVYTDKPSENFKDEWMFLTGRLAEGNRGIMSQETCWVLFGEMDRTEIQQRMPGLPERSPAQNTTAANPLPQNHNDKPLFSTQVWQEAVHLYKILLQTGFDGSDVDKKLQSAAKKELKQNRKIYKCIKQKHLNKTDLFSLNPGQERRDFIGKLLQRIVGKGGGKNYIGAQRLYEFGKKNYQNHN